MGLGDRRMSRGHYNVFHDTQSRNFVSRIWILAIRPGEFNTVRFLELVFLLKMYTTGPRIATQL